MADHQIGGQGCSSTLGIAGARNANASRSCFIFPFSSVCLLHLIIENYGKMAAALLEFILDILIPQRKVGFKVFSVPNPKIPGQTSIPGPDICLGSSDWAKLDRNMVALQ